MKKSFKEETGERFGMPKRSPFWMDGAACFPLPVLCQKDQQILKKSRHTGSGRPDGGGHGLRIGARAEGQDPLNLTADGQRGVGGAADGDFRGDCSPSGGVHPEGTAAHGK